MALATQCPHCYTSFRVANDQLKLYAGLVRCGSCQQTFNGIDHLLGPDQAPKVRPETPSQATPEINSLNDAQVAHIDEASSSIESSEITADINPIAEEPQNIEEEIQEEIQESSVNDANVISVEIASSEDIVESKIEIDVETDVEADAKVDAEVEVDNNTQNELADIILAASGNEVTADEEPKLNDSAILDDLGISNDNEPVISMQSLTELKNALDQIGEDLDILEEKSPSSDDIRAANIAEENTASVISNAYFDDIDSSDIEHIEAFPIEEETSAHSGSMKDDVTSSSLDIDDVLDDSNVHAETKTESKTESENESKNKAEIESISDTETEPEIEFEIESEPVSKTRTKPYDALMQDHPEEDDALEEEKPQFVIEAENKQKYGKWLTTFYSTMTIVLILLALGQLTYYFRNQVFAHIPQSRAHLIKACKLLNCSINLLAEKGAVTKESQELVLLSSNPQILTLSVLLQNKSNTAQAWPMIELTLSDNRKKTLVQKVFSPKEYLLDSKDVNRGIAANVEKNIDINFELSIPKADKYEVKLFYP